MSKQDKCVDEWWNEMDANQKELVRVTVLMVWATSERQLLQVRRGPGRLNFMIVDRPKSEGPADAKARARGGGP